MTCSVLIVGSLQDKGYKALYALNSFINLMLILFIDPRSHGESGILDLLMSLVELYKPQERWSSESFLEASVSASYLGVRAANAEIFSFLGGVFLQSAVL